MEVGCLKEIKQVSDGDERSGSSHRAEQPKGMISDTSNVESESDTDDFCFSVVQKSADYGWLTPVHEEVKGPDYPTYYSCNDKILMDISPESCQRVQRSSEKVLKQLIHQRCSSTNGRPNDLGNISLNLHATPAGGTLENLVKGLVTTLIKMLSFFRLFICRQERRIDDVHPIALVITAEKPPPQSVTEDDMSACLQRLEKLEALCDRLVSRPPEIPEEKEHLLLNSFDRIKSIEVDLERTKRVLHAAVVKQMEMVDTLEAVQQSSVRRRLFCS